MDDSPHDRLQAALSKVKFFPEKSPTGFTDLLDLRNAVEEVLPQLAAIDRRLRAERAKGMREAAQQCDVEIHEDLSYAFDYPTFTKRKRKIEEVRAAILSLADQVEKGE